MPSGRQLLRIAVLLAVVIGVSASASVILASTFLDNSVQVSDGVFIRSPSGAGATIDGQAEVNMSAGRLYPDSETVQLNTSGGNITFSSSIAANATVHVDEINGTHTNVTGIEGTDGGNLSINPGDKQRVNVSDSINHINFTAMNPSDDQADFDYAGPDDEFTIVTIHGLPTNQQIGAVDNNTGEFLDETTTDGSGVGTWNLSTSEHVVVLDDDPSRPVVNNSSATPTGDLDTTTPTLKIDINDSDFDPGDNVTVEWFVDSSKVNTEHITSNQTVSHTTSSLDGGNHTWHVEIEDGYGLQNQSETFDISVPSNVTIRNVTENTTADPGDYDVIDDAEAEISVAGDNETVDKQTVSDGNVSLEGLPVDEEYVIIVNTSNYHQRAIIVEDIFEQSSVFVLNKTYASVRNTFEVDDQTGKFPPGQNRLIVQRMINRSYYDSSEPKEYQWTTIGGDRLGADQRYVIDLRQDARYRLIVKNDDGDRRVLGEYTAKEEGTVPLTIGEVTVGTDYNGSYITRAWVEDDDPDDNQKTLRFFYDDTQDLTTKVEINITERGNRSNVLATDTRTGTLGEYVFTQTLTGEDANKTWVVNYTITRDGETFTRETQAGATERIIDNKDIIADKWLYTLSYVVLVLFAALWPGRIAHIGGVATVVLAGILILLGATDIPVTAWWVGATVAVGAYIARTEAEL